MKTLDEVIKALEYCTGFDFVRCQDCPGYCESDCGTQNDALHYLKEYQRYQNTPSRIGHMAMCDENEPLTWDELKGMEGKPVWTVESTVTYDDNGIERIGRWNIIREVTQEHIIFYIGLPYHKSWQGIGWQAYRKERE